MGVVAQLVSFGPEVVLVNAHESGLALPVVDEVSHGHDADMSVRRKVAILLRNGVLAIINSEDTETLARGNGGLGPAVLLVAGSRSISLEERGSGVREGILTNELPLGNVANNKVISVNSASQKVGDANIGLVHNENILVLTLVGDTDGELTSSVHTEAVRLLTRTNVDASILFRRASTKEELAGLDTHRTCCDGRSGREGGKTGYQNNG